MTARHREATTDRAVQASHAQGIIVQAAPVPRTIARALRQGVPVPRTVARALRQEVPVRHHVAPREAEDVEDAVSPNGPVS